MNTRWLSDPWPPGRPAVGAGAFVDVAVGGHVDVTAFFASRVDIGTCVNVFLCFGRLELLRYGLRRRVRA